MKEQIESEPCGCDSCGSDNLEHVSTSTYRGTDYETYKCLDCGNSKCG